MTAQPLSNEDSLIDSYHRVLASIRLYWY